MKTSNLRTALITAWLGAALLAFLTTGCRTERPADGTGIYPDYAGCRLPRNIAPCNFRILTPHTRYRLTVQQGGADGLNGNVLYQQRGKAVVQLPFRRWKKWLQAASGDTLWMARRLQQARSRIHI